MSNADIRWEQRFSNFNKALKKLTQAVDLVKKDLVDNELDLEDEYTGEVLEEVIKEGLKHRFEYTYELAWNVMKDYALFQGDASTEIGGSRDAIRYAFGAGLIRNGEVWMEMIQSRINTSHTYDEEKADKILAKIIDAYHDPFIHFQQKMESFRSGEQQKLDIEQ